MDRQNGRGRRRRFSPEVKWQAVQEARQGGVPVSQVCEKHGIRPGQFYQWEKRAEQGALQALREQRRGRKRQSPREEELIAEIERLREVIARDQCRELGLEKGALGLEAGRRYTAEEKARILETIDRVQSWNPGMSLGTACQGLGLARATGYRWRERCG